MKILFSCGIESKLRLGKAECIEQNDRLYKFIVDPHGFLNGVEIECKIVNPESFYSSVELTPDRDVAGKLRIMVDGDLVQSVVKDLQYLESILSFNQNLQTIF